MESSSSQQQLEAGAIADVTMMDVDGDTQTVNEQGRSDTLKAFEKSTVGMMVEVAESEMDKEAVLPQEESLQEMASSQIGKPLAPNSSPEERAVFKARRLSEEVHSSGIVVTRVCPECEAVTPGNEQTIPAQMLKGSNWKDDWSMSDSWTCVGCGIDVKEAHLSSVATFGKESTGPVGEGGVTLDPSAASGAEHGERSRSPPQSRVVLKEKMLEMLTRPTTPAVGTDGSYDYMIGCGSGTSSWGSASTPMPASARGMSRFDSPELGLSQSSAHPDLAGWTPDSQSPLPPIWQIPAWPNPPEGIPKADRCLEDTAGSTMGGMQDASASSTLKSMSEGSNPLPEQGRPVGLAPQAPQEMDVSGEGDPAQSVPPERPAKQSRAGALSDEVERKWKQLEPERKPDVWGGRSDVPEGCLSPFSRGRGLLWGPPSLPLRGPWAGVLGAVLPRPLFPVGPLWPGCRRAGSGFRLSPGGPPFLVVLLPP